MPNLRGGKAYKKSKGKSKLEDELANIIFIEKEGDQYIGRILKLLGNLNVQVYCEDKKQRICKIRSGIKKKIRFETGDIVLVSLRDCEMSGAELKEGIHSDRGDVIAKYHPQQFASLKDEGVNPLIFAHLDTLNTVTNMINNGDIAAADVILKDSVDDIFDRTVVAKEESDEEVCIDDI
jgi:initiation factor 1A